MNIHSNATDFSERQHEFFVNADVRHSKTSHSEVFHEFDVVSTLHYTNAMWPHAFMTRALDVFWVMGSQSTSDPVDMSKLKISSGNSPRKDFRSKRNFHPIQMQFIQLPTCQRWLLRSDVNISRWSLRWPDVFVLSVSELYSVWMMLHLRVTCWLRNATTRTTTFKVSLNWDLRGNISNAKQHCKHNHIFSYLRKLFLCVPRATCLLLVLYYCSFKRKRVGWQIQRLVANRDGNLLAHTHAHRLCVYFVCVDWDSGGSECNNLPHEVCVSPPGLCDCVLRWDPAYIRPTNSFYQFALIFNKTLHEPKTKQTL